MGTKNYSVLSSIAMLILFIELVLLVQLPQIHPVLKEVDVIEHVVHPDRHSDNVFVRHLTAIPTSPDIEIGFGTRIPGYKAAFISRDVPDMSKVCMIWSSSIWPMRIPAQRGLAGRTAGGLQPQLTRTGARRGS